LALKKKTKNKKQKKQTHTINCTLNETSQQSQKGAGDWDEQCNSNLFAEKVQRHETTAQIQSDDTKNVPEGSGKPNAEEGVKVEVTNKNAIRHVVVVACVRVRFTEFGCYRSVECLSIVIQQKLD
jgi:hypothetical protein